MQFAHPLFIPAGLICCTVALILLQLLQKRRQAALAQFAGAQLLGRLTRHVSTGRRRFKQFLLLLAIFLLFVAMARPQYGFTWVEVTRKGIDILFALDTSKSMLAEDTRPNRLQRAKLGIMDFVGRLQGDRVGLMPFAGTAYLMCPLTLDYEAFTSTLASIDSDIIPVGGTNISAVIEEAEQVLQNDANHKILVLLTDGENLQGDAVETAKKAKDKGLTIYTVGVGTPGGELIPLPADGGLAGFVKDEQGKYVTSKLDEEILTAIAEATGGLYASLGNSGEGLETIYQRKLNLIPKEQLAERRQKVPVERYIWPLAAAIFLLVFEYLIPERKSGRRLSIPTIFTAGRRNKNRLAPMLLLAILVTFAARNAVASAADEAYARGDYLKASELYSQALKKHPDDPKLHYNLGTAAYKNNLYDEAIAAFTQALKGDDLSLQEKAYYNRGNALFQKGSESRQADPQATVEKWQQALESYDGALKLNPKADPTRENRQFVEQKLQELQKQLEQQQNQEPKDSSQDQQQDKQQKNQKQQNEKNSQDQKKDQEQGKQNSPDEQIDKAGNDDSGEQQKPDEQQNKQDQSRKTDPDSAGKEGDKQPQPVAANEQNGPKADQDAEKNRDMARRELGKMTREEAENLLKALKNEEGELNFVPRGSGQDSEVRRDW